MQTLIHLALIAEHNIHFSAICLQIAWLDPHHDVYIFHIPDYKMINRGKSCSAHGGLIIYLKDEYTVEDERQLCNDSNVWESLFIDIEHEGLDNKITLANNYRPPKNNDNNTVLGEFNEEIRPTVTQYPQERSYCIITGDTNINLLKVKERFKFQEYFDIFITNGLFPKITFPTRYDLNRNTASLIDDLFCKFIDGENFISSGRSIGNISDHLPYFAHIRLKKKITRKNKIVLVYKILKNLWIDFRMMSQTQWITSSSKTTYWVIQTVLTTLLKIYWWKQNPNTSNHAKLVLINTNTNFLRGFRLV